MDTTQKQFKDVSITGNEIIDSMDLQELQLTPELKHGALATQWKQRVTALLHGDRVSKTLRLQNVYDHRNKISAKKTSRNAQEKLRAKTRFIQTESEKVSAKEGNMGDFHTGDPVLNTTNENVQDHMGEKADKSSLGKTLHSVMDGGDTQFALDNYFRRPISIFSGDIDGDFFSRLDVWDLWSRDPSVRAKLSNYAYFKGNLHLRIAVSGTPYHYGRILFSYQPYIDYNQPYRALKLLQDDTFTGQDASVRGMMNCYLSQAPGTKTIDPKDNMPLEMCCPFISYKTKYRLTANDGLVITNSTPFPDLEEAGALVISTINPIRFANTTTATSNPVSVNIFAWCEEIELGCITATNIDITAESAVVDRINRYSDAYDSKGMSGLGNAVMKDARNGEAVTTGGQGLGTYMSDMASGVKAEVTKTEYEDPGPVTKVATAISNVGGMLSDVPIIGDFAKATSAVFKGLGAVSNFFGFSKPVILEPAMFVKNMPFQNGAVGNVKETAYMLAVDPKIELSVDPSIGGMNVDELVIGNIASRKSYIGTFDWSDADVAMTDVLWNTTVDPNMGIALIGARNVREEDQPNGGTLNNYCQDSALAFSSRPFSYWRGTINYTFEVVCSRFHRGKLLIRYEPNTYQYETLIKSNSAPLNQQNSVILDIQNGQTVTIAVDWAATRSWCLLPTSANRRGIVDASDSTAIRPYGNSNNFFTSTLFPGLSPITDNRTAASANGILEVRVLNQLVQPIETADVQVNVYCWSEDMQYARPSIASLPNNRMIGQAANPTIVSESAVIPSEEVVVINPTGASDEHIHDDHMGEKVISFRTLLKRFQTVYYLSNLGTPEVPDVVNMSFRGTVLPQASTGYAGPGALPARAEPDTGGLVPPIETNPRTLFEFLRYGFLGMRGSMKHRLRPHGNFKCNSGDYCTVALAQSRDDVYAVPELKIRDMTSDASFLDTKRLNVNTLYGNANYHLDSNGGFEFVTPYYNPNLWQLAFNSGTNLPSGPGTSTGGSNLGVASGYPSTFVATFNGNAVVTTTAESDPSIFVSNDTAIGEDFQFFRFMGAPIVKNNVTAYNYMTFINDI